MEPIAIVGMGGVFPEAPDCSAFWQNILAKRDTTVDVPAHRWTASPQEMLAEGYQPDKAYSRRACLIRDFDLDPMGFNLSADTISQLDPLYRLLLQAGKEATSDHPFQHLDRNRIGVIIAAIALPTQGASALARRLLAHALEIRVAQKLGLTESFTDTRANNRHHYSANVTSLPASLLADNFDLGGGAFTLDAACASSLYAIKLACDQLNAYRTDAMLAGGVSRPDCLYTQVGFSQLRALSPSGRCAPFDRSADGLVVGEGAGVLVLKRLPDAISANESILGVIHGIGLSNDLYGNLLAPDSEGQIRAMKAAYAASGWSVDDVDIIECHGAGTPLGDATELASLRQLWGETGWEQEQCALGSIKSMIGHLLTAAASAGLIKLLLALKHRILPPTLHFKNPPAESPLTNGPFRVPTDIEPWHRRNDETPRRAAINAFGFGGINAHLLIEEYRETAAVNRPPGLLASNLKTAKPMNRSGDHPVAIVGMGASFGQLDSLNSFETAVFGAESVIKPRPPKRWKGCDPIADRLLGLGSLPGNYIDHIHIVPGYFRIPPAEIPDILPQHLLMLKTAKEAFLDAGFPIDQDLPGGGTIIGIDFDYEATTFHLRWQLFNQVNKLNRKLDLGLSASELTRWRDQLADSVGRPLTHERTLGALGSMVASRLAREFRLGGPSFVLSAGPGSGIEALNLGLHSLRRRETDTMLIGAVDLFGDIRRIVLSAESIDFARGDTIQPFHLKSDGTLPGEGAGAIVIKRLDDALAANDRIYAVIDNVVTTHGKSKNSPSIQSAYSRALQKALDGAGWCSKDLDIIELHGSGDPFEDAIEAKTLPTIIDPETTGYTPCHPGTVKPVIGHTGSTAAMASLIKTALCLHHRKVSPDPSSPEKNGMSIGGNTFTPPPEQISSSFKKAGSNCRAVVMSITSDGGVGAALMAGWAGHSGTSGQSAGRTKTSPLKPPTGAAPIIVEVGGFPDPPPLPPGVTIHRPLANDIDELDHAPDGTDDSPQLAILQQLVDSTKKTEKAHRQFLEFSAEITRAYGETLTLENEILMRSPGLDATLPGLDQSNHQPIQKPSPSTKKLDNALLFSREMCMEFATGSVGKVLGSEFAVVDSYPVRVRLPDEPLMLVDRILFVDGKKGGLGSGRIVTEHDVRPDAWYLDGNSAPVCIAVEAGQADLFLCAYLGIDFKVKGKRAYRLLDATVQFHRGLPRPGDVIRYDIHIDRFVRRGDTYLFFFRFDGTINGQPLITMTDGCAGFFTPEEVENSGGIIDTTEEDRSSTENDSKSWEALVPGGVPNGIETVTDEALDALRRGDPTTCFGNFFKGVRVPDNLRLPGDRMRLIHRITHLDYNGGQRRLGLIRAEADINPTDWFLTCHFVDDMVMPGTLMYECCAHTLRVLLQRMGWFCNDPQTCYEPVTGVHSRLKCRGPGTPSTNKVTYEVEITNIGYHPVPYVIGDAHMFADGRQIVRFNNISMQLTGATLNNLKRFWRKSTSTKKASSIKTFEVVDKKRLLAFARGNPSEAFGERYQPFDKERFIARLPAPPYLFIDRITECGATPWVLKSGGWAEAEFHPSPDDWYFHADRSGFMPYAICLEIALQPCGWLAAYMGSALLSNQDLRFRNLGGHVMIKKDLPIGHHHLKTRVRLTQVSKAADMIIETFDFQIRDEIETVYQGNTYFGFFTENALAQQEGLRDLDLSAFTAEQQKLNGDESLQLLDTQPFMPNQPSSTKFPLIDELQMPAKALRMIDTIQHLDLTGGPSGLGYIRAGKQIDPKEWFFKAHFYQDPVCPGSLGIEAFIQKLKYYALTIWKNKVKTHRFSICLPKSHEWIYRGQIVPSDNEVAMETIITSIEESDACTLIADGYLSVDGRYIYAMKQFGIRLIPH